MIVRAYEETDLPRLQQLMDPALCELKDLNDPRYLAKFAVCDQETPVAFGFSRLLSEAFLVLDKGWRTPAWRWQALQLVHDAARDRTVYLGVDKSVTWVPKAIEKSYGKRLASLGWDKQERSSFVYEVPHGK